MDSAATEKACARGDVIGSNLGPDTEHLAETLPTSHSPRQMPV
jgi:hypothetical protein